MTTMHPLLKVLHVGVTNRGQWPLKLCTGATGFAPHALCDVSPAALEKAREETGLPASACFTDLDEAIKKSGADCAVVCAPTVHHVPIGLKMIAAKMPVLIEKGMAPSWELALRLTRAAAENHAIVAIAQNYRYNSLEKTIWKSIHDPASETYVGKVHEFSYSQQRVRPVPNTLNYPFASIWDMSCHHFDNLQFWLGPLDEMTAFSWKAGWSAYQHDCNTSSHMRYGDAHVHYIHTHDAVRSTLDIEVHGEKGGLFLRDEKLTFNERPVEQWGYREPVPVKMLPSGNEGDVLRDFHRYIVEGIEPGISVRNNLPTMATCEMMVRSIVEKRTVTHSEMEKIA